MLVDILGSFKEKFAGGMQIFGFQVNNSYVYIGTGTLSGLGICYALYKVFKRKTKEKLSDNELLAIVEDLSLPVLLEHEFGDFRHTCQAADPVASAFLKEIPKSFFKFNDALFDFYSTHFAKKRFSRCRNALVIGSKAGRLVFDLAKIFKDVRGLDLFFSRVVTCYKFQNENLVRYDFPLEGSYRTATQAVSIPTHLPSSKYFQPDAEAFRSVEKLRKLKQHKDNIEFLNVDIGNTTQPLYLGQFQVVFITDEINEAIDPERLLINVHRYVETDGLLIIYTDYNWKRTTNQKLGFGKSSLISSFDFLKFMLLGFFDFVEEKNIPDVIGQSLRTCTVRNMHVTVWERNSRPILP